MSPCVVFAWKLGAGEQLAFGNSPRSGKLPSEPNLKRGCSLSVASPRRSNGAKAGRWTLNAGRTEQRRAREAARGKNEAILCRLKVVTREFKVSS